MLECDPCPLCGEPRAFRVGDATVPNAPHNDPDWCAAKTLQRIRLLEADKQATALRVADLLQQVEAGRNALRELAEVRAYRDARRQWSERIHAAAPNSDTHAQLAERVLLAVVARTARVDDVQFESNGASVTTLIQVTEFGTAPGEFPELDAPPRFEIAERVGLLWFEYANRLRAQTEPDAEH